MSFSGDDHPLKSTFETIHLSYESELSTMKQTSLDAALWRNMRCLSREDVPLSSSEMDRLENCYNVYESSKKRLLSLRADVISFRDLSDSLLSKMDSVFSSNDLSGQPLVEKTYRPAFVSTDDGGQSVWNWTLCRKARDELRRRVPLGSDGSPIPTMERFSFGSVCLFGWEVCALFDCLVRGPLKMHEALTCDDDDSYETLEDEAWKLFLPIEDSDRDDSFALEEAPSSWHRLVVPPEKKRKSSVLPPPVPSVDADADGDSDVELAPLPSKKSSGVVSKVFWSSVHMDSALKRLRFLTRCSESDVANRVSRKLETKAKKLSRCTDPSKKKRLSCLTSSPWVLNLEGVYSIYPGSEADVDLLRSSFGYSKGCYVKRSWDGTCVIDMGLDAPVIGVHLEGWSLVHRACLQRLLMSYRDLKASGGVTLPLSVPDVEDSLHVAAYLHPESCLYTTGGSIFEELRVISKDYLDREWFDVMTVWDWPLLVFSKVRDVLKERVPHYSRKFGSDVRFTMEKYAYVTIFAESPYCTPEHESKLLSLADAGGILTSETAMTAYEYVSPLSKVKGTVVRPEPGPDGSTYTQQMLDSIRRKFQDLTPDETSRVIEIVKNAKELRTDSDGTLCVCPEFLTPVTGRAVHNVLFPVQMEFDSDDDWDIERDD